MYKNYLKTRSHTLLEKYKIYKNKLQTIIRNSEKLYYSNKISQLKDNMSKTWKVINTMINKSKPKKDICRVDINGTVVTDAKYCRIITFSKFNEHSRPLFVKLSILSVYDTYKYQLLIHVYKEVKNISPVGSQYYTENSAIHKYYTRQNSNLHLPQYRTSLKRNTISFQGPLLWNALPDKIKSCQSLNIFKRKLKLFLLSELL